MVGGVRGISIVEVVRVALMTIDMAQMRGTRLEVLITDLSKFFDVIPQDMHPLVAAWIGLGTYEELRAHTEGYSYVVPLGDIQSPELLLGVGVPQGSIQGVQAGITAAIPFLATLAKNYGRSMANPMRSVAQMWVDDTLMAFAAEGGPRAQSALLDQQVYFTGILGIDIASKKVQWSGPGGSRYGWRQRRR